MPARSDSEPRLGYLFEEDPIEDDGLVLAPDGETLVSPALAADLEEPEEDPLMVEARRLDHELDEDDEDDDTVSSMACETCANRHNPPGSGPCVSCDLTTDGDDSNYSAESDQPFKSNEDDNPE